MGTDVLRVLGTALKRVMTVQSSYVNGADADWDDIAAQVILQCDGKVAVMSQKEYDAVLGDSFCDTCSDEPIHFGLGK